MIELCLPVPVSVNDLLGASKKGGRLKKTVAARDWERDAREFVMPFYRQYQKICNHNINTRARYWNPRRKDYDLTRMRDDFQGISYVVEYRFVFPSNRVRDVFNYEKQLSDFLVDMGFMLDDQFIDDGRVIRMPIDKNTARVDVKIWPTLAEDDRQGT